MLNRMPGMREAMGIGPIRAGMILNRAYQKIKRSRQVSV